jgi:hypothetical protein
MGIPVELSKNRLVQASSDKRFGMLWYFHKPTAASCALALSPQALVFAIAFAIAFAFIWLPQACLRAFALSRLHAFARSALTATDLHCAPTVHLE